MLLEFEPRPINSQSALARTYKLIDRLMSTPRLTRSQSEMLEMLSMLVEQYESREHPTPNVSAAEMLYIVRLNDEERQVCMEVIRKLKGTSQKVRRGWVALFGTSPVAARERQFMEITRLVIVLDLLAVRPLGSRHRSNLSCRRLPHEACERVSAKQVSNSTKGNLRQPVNSTSPTRGAPRSPLSTSDGWKSTGKPAQRE